METQKKKKKELRARQPNSFVNGVKFIAEELSTDNIK